MAATATVKHRYIHFFRLLKSFFLAMARKMEGIIGAKPCELNRIFHLFDTPSDVNRRRAPFFKRRRSESAVAPHNQIGKNGRRMTHCDIRENWTFEKQSLCCFFFHCNARKPPMGRRERPRVYAQDSPENIHFSTFYLKK